MTTLYHTDFYLWTQDQAALLREGKVQALDLDNLAEEIESLGKSQRHELEHRLDGLLMHLLKWRYQPSRRQAGRFSGPGKPYAGLVRKTSQGWRWTGEVRLIAQELETPLRWKKPRRIFVNAMSDLFQESVSEDLIDAVLAVMALAPQHTFQVLTKRPARMMAYMTERWPPARAQSLTLSGTRLDLPAEPHGVDRHRQILNTAERLLHGPLGEPARVWTTEGGPLSHAQPWPLPNVWLGTSVEDQATAEA